MNPPVSSTTVPAPLDAVQSVSVARARRVLWDDLAVLTLFGALVLVFLTFQDYGITHDEEVQAIYGEKLLSWYTSLFSDNSAFSYLDLFWYGGLFDLVSALLNKVSPFGYYETRHLLGGMVGVAGLAGIWRLGSLAGGPRAGFLALLLLASTPAYVGHSFNNPKDAPFAAAMVWAIYAIACVARELPKPSRRSLIGLGVALGVALSIRVGALLLVFYAGLAVLAHLGMAWHRHGVAEAGRRLRGLLLPGLGVLAVAYAIIAVFWPWAVIDPTNPIHALSHFSRYNIDIVSLFNGELVPATHIPAAYLPGYLLVTLPEMVLAGLAIMALGVAAGRWNGSENKGAIALTALAAFFPVLFFIIFRPTAYDGIRHFLFILPALAVLAALGLERVWAFAENAGERPRRAFVVALTCLGVGQAWIMGRLHPNEYIYYNALVGGVAGADGKWEMDYWSNSMHEAVDRLAELVRLENGGMAPTVPVKVGLCGNDLSATYFFPPYLQLARTLEEADYAALFTQGECWKTWRGKPVVEVERFGAVLSVVKDRRGLARPGEE